MKNVVDGDVKLSYIEIAFSPILSLWSMAKSKEDIIDEIDLNPDSSDKKEAYLAKSREKIDEDVNNYGGKGKGKNKIEGIKVKLENLGNTEQTLESVQKRTISDDKEIEH